MTYNIFRPAFCVAPVLASCLGMASALYAQQTDAVTGAEILPGWRTESNTRMAAFSLTLLPGWKTYWRAPGDSGIPPQFDWSGSQNVASVRIHWPRPTVFHINGLQQIGYHDQMVLPIEVTPVDPGSPMVLQARVDLGVCKEICVPASVDLHANLSGNGAGDPAIRDALRSRPDTAGEAGLSKIACSVDPIDDGLRITATMNMPDQGGVETVVFETADATVWVAQSIASRSGSVLTATTEMVSNTGAPFGLDRSDVVVTVLGESGAVEIRGCPSAN